MISSRTAQRYIFAERFQPLRIRTTAGRTFEVEHPEHVGMGVTTVVVFAPPENDPDGPQRWVDIPFTEIESIDPVTVPAAPGSL